MRHKWIIRLTGTLRLRHLIHSRGFATSGILGAKLAAQDRPCVAVVGTGSWDLPPLPSVEPNFLKVLQARAEPVAVRAAR